MVHNKDYTHRYNLANCLFLTRQCDLDGQAARNEQHTRFTHTRIVQRSVCLFLLDKWHYITIHNNACSLCTKHRRHWDYLEIHKSTSMNIITDDERYTEQASVRAYVCVSVRVCIQSESSDV